MTSVAPKALNLKDVEQELADLGKKLRGARVAKGWTQAEMAGLIGISIPSYQAMESGTGKGALWTWVWACAVLELELIL